MSSFKDIKDFTIIKLARELIEQGHQHTGSAIKSLEGVVNVIPDGVEIVISGNKYLIFIDRGVKANRIPYKRGRRRGGQSDYIKGLIAYFRKKGAKDPKAAAFATANKHKKEGMPTKNSFKFSRNGKRTNFIGDTLAKHGTNIEDQLAEAGLEGIGDKVDLMFDKFDKV